jgi:uncharacterized membrane protein
MANLRHRSLVALLLTASVALALPAVAADFRGFAAAGPVGVILFQPCRGNALDARVLKLEDRTPDAALASGMEAVRKIMLEAGRPMYVEFSGTSDGKVAQATQFHRAVGTVQGCGEVPAIPAGATVWAYGGDPPWLLVATRAGARLDRPGLPPMRFAAAPFAPAAKPAAQRTIDAWSAQDGGSVRLTITEAMCSDGRSETAYGARATLRVGSSTYEGCAARF